MFRIKVCGVTSVRDAEAAVEAGADAVGINFYRGSARFVSPRAAAPIVEAVRGRAAVVGVFVDETPEVMAAVCGDLGIEVVQLSGHESAAVSAGLGLPAIKAVRMEGESGLAPFRDYPCRAFLLDAAAPGMFGGTGRPLDWEALGRVLGGGRVRFEGGGGASSGTPWMLAGGLTPETVAEAIRAARPFGVDVASGVESAPGRKDARKLKAFVERARKGFERAGIDG